MRAVGRLHRVKGGQDADAGVLAAAVPNFLCELQIPDWSLSRPKPAVGIAPMLGCEAASLQPLPDLPNARKTKVRELYASSTSVKD